MRSIIKGKRVTLRKLRKSDIDDITKYCSDRRVSKWTLHVPYPYKKKDAIWFTKDSAKKWGKDAYVYSVRHEGKLVGVIDIRPREYDSAEIGYWVGREHWGKGFASEATKLIIKEGFKTLKLHKIFATHKPGNKASARVMQKAGMKYEGTIRDQVKKGKKYLDMVHYGILRKEFRR